MKKELVEEYQKKGYEIVREDSFGITLEKKAKFRFGIFLLWSIFTFGLGGLAYWFYTATSKKEKYIRKK